ncbi:serine hydrolase domain-containing protein [Emticicia agri]|uniref:Class A beta-lactamase-related serine hydrolase n=1 Tax=Emticicia agri TaxID=2492393 RepID=A0A4Q5M3V7_9BACT|nr:serine hydrolase domain-containing protein [Emticicia agri]RYU96779.1 class A beta-lactamase-related serine hydrolase [Emticicia agri]
MKKLFIITVIYFTAFANTQAQSTTNQKLDSLFTQITKNGDFNGGILVADKGKIIYQKGLGYADFANKIPNEADSRFNLASISKTFTSVAILQLKEKKKLKLEDAFVKYFPDFPFPTITIKHLLSHTSGLPDLELYESVVNAKPDSIIRNQAIIPILKNWNQKLYFQPGDKWKYCNTNYALLALLVEKVSKMSFKNYLSKNIFEPANMPNTYLRIGAIESPKKQVVNHRLITWYDDTYKNVDSIRFGGIKYCTYNCGGTYGDSNIMTTTADMLNYDQALYNGKLLSQNSLDEAFTPTRLNDGTIYYDPFGDEMSQLGKSSYGLGWEIYENAELGKAVSHGGHLFGLATLFYRNLSKNQTVVLYQNVEREGLAFYGKVLASLEILNGKTPQKIFYKKSLARKYGSTMMHEGIDRAVTVFNDLKTDSTNYYLSENEMNWLGYDFLFNARQKQYSLETFKVNTLLFPNSFNVYDSYAEALNANGKREEAILMYQKSIAMNPDNKGGKEMLKRILENKQ